MFKQPSFAAFWFISVCLKLLHNISIAKNLLIHQESKTKAPCDGRRRTIIVFCMVAQQNIYLIRAAVRDLFNLI